MAHTIRNKTFPGTPDPTPRSYEAPHAALSRRAASEGFVLLKNDNHCLPLQPGCRVALYGAGASQTVKGGTGSGDVNERRCVSIREGLEKGGFAVVTGDWLDTYDEMFTHARYEWRDRVMKKRGEKQLDFFSAYSSTPFKMPVGPAVTKVDADVAVYVLSRIAGEGADRRNVPGDFQLSDGERAMLRDICRYYDRVIVLLNTGSAMDLDFMDQHPNIEALLLIVQPGMEAGSAVADVLSGRVNPSGHLADTWAFHYEDYPCAEQYSHNDGDTLHAFYNEGIYVGYRYFDSFNIPVRYGFGGGLSYTRFEIGGEIVSTDSEGRVTVNVDVTNVGDRAGREVVQLYAMPPEGRLEKEVRRLTAFGKTGLLNPGQSETLTLTFGPDALASYDEAASAWVLEPGRYGLFVGASLMESRLCAWLTLDSEIVLEVLRSICPLKDALNPLSLSAESRRARCAELTAGVDAHALPYRPTQIATRRVDYAEPAESEDEATRLAASLTTEQLIQLVVGAPAAGSGGALGAASMMVPGAAGQTSACALNDGVADIALADGPAGVRLIQRYTVKDDQIVTIPSEASFERGLFYDGPAQAEGEAWYQFCTAIPVGTLLAQTWDIELIEALGDLIGDEMTLFGVTLWLAPGMNLHRNPLCGRNFEYYSEDPLLTGRLAAAMTRGVQRHPGCGVTVKHFCCNNQEDDRMKSDSILSERTLREMYLRGFGIAIREAHPLAIMTSYNLVNGIHAANHRDLCTDVARREFGFRGFIMTDWTTTEQGPDCTASGCIRAGNDLVMPGQYADQDDIRHALGDGRLSHEDLLNCATRIIRVILQSNRYE